MAGKLGDVLRQLGETLRDDRAARAHDQPLRPPRGGRRSRPIMATRSSGWCRKRCAAGTRDTITSRLENAVGRDLQYIRINGTLVGGLVGLVIHTVDVLL